MEFSYEQNGRKILCSYWSAPFSFTQFEKACEVFDEIQIWYPIEVDDRIYEKYGNIISYIDLGGRVARERFFKADRLNPIGGRYFHLKARIIYIFTKIILWRTRDLSIVLL